MPVRKGRKSVPARPAQADVCAAQHAAIMQQVNTVLAADQAAQNEFKATMQSHLIDEPRWQERIELKVAGIDRIEGKVDTIADGLRAVMSIKVNGTEPLPGEFPLQTSLRGLHEVVRVEAVKIKFWKTFAEWRQQVFFFRILRTKAGGWIIKALLLLLAGSIAQAVGVNFSIQEGLKLLK